MHRDRNDQRIRKLQALPVRGTELGCAGSDVSSDRLHLRRQVGQEVVDRPPPRRPAPGRTDKRLGIGGCGDRDVIVFADDGRKRPYCSRVVCIVGVEDTDDDSTRRRSSPLRRYPRGRSLSGPRRRGCLYPY